MAEKSPQTAKDSELLNVPPQNIEAEKAVIGSLLIDPQLCDDVVLMLRPDDFYSDANRKLFEHIVAMHDSGGRIDMMLLVERLRQAGDFDAIGRLTAAEDGEETGDRKGS